jgi:2-phosphoglycolate phosphatase
MRQIEPYQAVVFDLDGTLVHTLPELSRALDAALQDCGLEPLPQHIVRATLHGGLEASAHAAIAHHGVHHALLPDLTTAYRRRYSVLATESLTFEGVPDALFRLRARGVRLGVCTNKAYDEAVALLDRLGILDTFSIIVGADSCARRKPDPMPLRLAIDTLGVPLEKALYVGDSIVDARCARATGVDFWLHGRGYGIDEVLRDYTVPTFCRYDTAFVAINPAAE